MSEIKFNTTIPLGEHSIKEILVPVEITAYYEKEAPYVSEELPGNSASATITDISAPDLSGRLIDELANAITETWLLNAISEHIEGKKAEAVIDKDDLWMVY